tara:strand:+ start:1812 stop:2255 length:444 start_codon:yes stop_codon:yes gene_type:complete
VVRGQLKKCPDGTVNTVYPPTEYKGSSQGRPPSQGDRKLRLEGLHTDIKPGSTLSLPDGRAEVVKAVVHQFAQGSNPCSEVTLGPAQPCALKPRRIFPSLIAQDLVSVQPMPTPVGLHFLGFDDIPEPEAPIPRPPTGRLRDFDPLW